MKTIDYAQLDNWKDQSLIDSLAWNKKSIETEKSVKTAYEAGFENGWQEAVNMLRIHAGLALTYGGEKVG
jgi:hypothetical protein